VQTHRKIEPYQQLRYGSNVPFRHGPVDVVKYSATPCPNNPAHPLQRSNPNALQDELRRHLNEDGTMASFDFGLQFLHTDRMRYWDKPQDAEFRTENTSVEWHEAQTPFHTVARLTLVPKSRFPPELADAIYFDVTGNTTPDSPPVGSINRARQQNEVASRRARMHPDSKAS
jgi:hypothetical protein